MNKSFDNIRENILKILKSKYDLELSFEQCDENFFGNKIQFSARNLIDLILDLERYFHLHLDENKLKTTDILTVNGFTSILAASLNDI